MNFRNPFKKKTKTQVIQEVKELEKEPELTAITQPEPCIFYDMTLQNCKLCTKTGCCVSCIHGYYISAAESPEAVERSKAESIRLNGPELAKIVQRPQFFDMISVCCKINFTEPELTPKSNRDATRKFKKGYPCFANGQPCPRWQSALVTIFVTKEKFWRDGR